MTSSTNILAAAQTPAVPTTSNVKQLLPQFVRAQSGNVIRPREDPAAFVYNELDVNILDGLVHWLWVAGRLDNVRQLHHQKLLGREIVLTERAKAHLLWTENKIFLKPLPAWLLDDAFVKDNIAIDSKTSAQANGFLRSYLFLLQYESDFRMAKECCIVPDGLTWSDWLKIVDKNSHLITDGEHKRSPRYQYGELRLYRVNLLYRFWPPFRSVRFFRGYVYGHANYKGFIQRNFAWLLAVFLYVTIILTAMQLGLATKELENNLAFHQASYGFAVFSIFLPLIAVVYILALSAVMVVYNVSATLIHVREKTKALEKARKATSGPV